MRGRWLQTQEEQPSRQVQHGESKTGTQTNQKRVGDVSTYRREPGVGRPGYWDYGLEGTPEQPNRLVRWRETRRVRGLSRRGGWGDGSQAKGKKKVVRRARGTYQDRVSALQTPAKPSGETSYRGAGLTKASQRNTQNTECHEAELWGVV